MARFVRNYVLPAPPFMFIFLRSWTVSRAARTQEKRVELLESTEPGKWALDGRKQEGLWQLGLGQPLWASGWAYSNARHRDAYTPVDPKAIQREYSHGDIACKLEAKQLTSTLRPLKDELKRKESWR